MSSPLFGLIINVLPTTPTGTGSGVPEINVVGWTLWSGVFAVGLYWLLILARSNTWYPWVVAIGEDGRLSTSKFQFFLWTGVVMFAYTIIFAARATHAGSALFGYVDTLPGNVLTAMGGSALTAAFAQGITGSFHRSGRIVKKSVARSADLGYLVTDDNGNPDLGKIQMLSWTILAALFYIVRVISGLNSYATCVPHPGDVSCFPDIDGALMGLMLLGQGGYLATKLAANTTSAPSTQDAGGAAGALNTIEPTGIIVDDVGAEVIEAVEVQLVFWGTSWNAATSLVNTIATAAASILSGPYMTKLRQYGYVRSGSLRGQKVLGTTNPPTQAFSEDDVSGFVRSAIELGQLPPPTSQTLYSVFTPETYISDQPDKLGEHSYVDTSLGRAYYAWIVHGTPEHMTRTFSHELVEACTDPFGKGFQVRPADPTHWHEICDVCPNRIGSLGGVTVQGYWSKSDNACVIPGIL